MLEISKISEWLKLSGKQAFILCVISSTLLFGSEELLKILGLDEALLDLKIWVGVIWLLSSAILAAEMVLPIYSWIKNKVLFRINLKKYQQRLLELTQDEKQFLSGYLRENTRTQSAAYSDGTVSGLVSANILYRSSNMAHHYNVFPYNIQPWAWEYLNEHPECLT